MYIEREVHTHISRLAEESESDDLLFTIVCTITITIAITITITITITIIYRGWPRRARAM